MIKKLKKAWLEIGLSVSSSGIEVQENFEIDDVVFLDDEGLIEQAYDKEDE